MSKHTFFFSICLRLGRRMGSCFRRPKDDIRVLGILLYTVPMSQESSYIMSSFQILLIRHFKQLILNFGLMMT